MNFALKLSGEINFSTAVKFSVIFGIWKQSSSKLLKHWQYYGL